MKFSFSSFSVSTTLYTSLLLMHGGGGDFKTAEASPTTIGCANTANNDLNDYIQYVNLYQNKGYGLLPDCNTPAVDHCMKALFKSKFNVLDIDHYANWWKDETSYVKVAETGTYSKLFGVKEYMSYGIGGGNFFSVGFNPSNPTYRIPIVLEASSTNNQDLDGPSSAFGHCKVAFVTDYVYDWSGGIYSHLLKDTGKIGAAILGLYEYDFTLEDASDDDMSYGRDGDTIQIDSLHGYFPPSFWTESGDKFDSIDFKKFVCESMKEHCNDDHEDVWEFNGYPSGASSAVAECFGDVMELPLTDNAAGTLAGGWKGSSLGCRQMHLSFILNGNDAHCPHISELPMVDVNGNTKCQDSNYDGTTVQELFDDRELELTKYIGMNIFGYDDSLLSTDP